MNKKLRPIPKLRKRFLNRIRKNDKLLEHALEKLAETYRFDIIQELSEEK